MLYEVIAKFKNVGIELSVVKERKIYVKDYVLCSECSVLFYDFIYNT